MDFANLGIDLAIVAAIIALTEVAKSLDPAKKLARFYILIPTILGVAAAFIVSRPLQWQEVAKNIVLYVGAATYLFKFGKTVVVGQ